MRIDLSAVVGVDGQTSKELEEALAVAGKQMQLRRGDVLVQQGDPSDALYFVLSGRFGVYRDSDLIAEIAQGYPIGEIGFFAGLRRTATVIALRDSIVLSLTRERYREINKTCPNIRDAVIVSLARRLSVDSRPVAARPPIVRTVAIVWAGGTRPSNTFVDALRTVFSAVNKAVFLTQQEIAAQLPGVSIDDPEAFTWLNSLEAASDFVFYIADSTLTKWTQKCIRQADAVLLVAAAGASTEPNSSERFVFSVFSRSARRLVILHEARTNVASGSSAWLGPRDVLLHHHVALQDLADVRRLSRFLSGRAVGCVAAGGGALGSAHLGAYKALCEAGADFDILGGTSVGAAMMAAFACGLDAERADEGTENIFVRHRSFRRFTLPRYGLLDHKIFDRALREEYGDILIEDLWVPFYALSTNLSDQQPKIHRRGFVWQAVRASCAIPGILPPFFSSEGEMLVDGALMDNVPLAAMKSLKTGSNAIIMLRTNKSVRYQVDYDSIPGARELAVRMLNPFAYRRLAQVPNLLQVLTLSMFASTPTDLSLSNTDVLIKPSLPKDLGVNSWERHTETFECAYRSVAASLRARIAEGDPAVLVLVGAA